MKRFVDLNKLKNLGVEIECEIAPQVRGRMRFSTILLETILLHDGNLKTLPNKISEIIQDLSTRNCPISLLTACDIFVQEYGELVAIQQFAKLLVHSKAFRGYIQPARNSDSIDFLSTGLCQLVHTNREYIYLIREPLVIQTLMHYFATKQRSFVSTFFLPRISDLASSASALGDDMDLMIALSLCEKRGMILGHFLEKIRVNQINIPLPEWVNSCQLPADSVYGTAHRKQYKHVVGIPASKNITQFVEQNQSGIYLPTTREGPDFFLNAPQFVILGGHKTSCSTNISHMKVDSNYPITCFKQLEEPAQKAILSNKNLKGIICLHVILPRGTALNFSPGIFIKKQQLFKTSTITRRLDVITANIDITNLERTTLLK